MLAFTAFPACWSGPIPHLVSKRNAADSSELNLRQREKGERKTLETEKERERKKEKFYD